MIGNEKTINEDSNFHYKQKSLIDLQKISPMWAYGQNLFELFDDSLNPCNNQYKIYVVSIKTLIEKSEFYEVNPNILFNGEEINDSRISRILFRWENQLFVDPPTVGISNDSKNKLSFSDGRHRTKLAYLLGNKTIPIAIHNSQISSVFQILDFQ